MLLKHLHRRTGFIAVVAVRVTEVIAYCSQIILQFANRIAGKCRRAFGAPQYPLGVVIATAQNATRERHEKISVDRIWQRSDHKRHAEVARLQSPPFKLETEIAALAPELAI